MSKGAHHFFKRQKARRRKQKEKLCADTDSLCKAKPRQAQTGEGGE